MTYRAEKVLKYKCEKCGKRAVLGSHFCNEVDIQKYQNKKDYNPDIDLGYDQNDDEPKRQTVSKHSYAIGTVALAIVLASFSYQTFGFLIIPILGIFAALILFLIYRKKLHTTLSDRYGELLRMCNGDRSLADRLILSEVRRNTEISRQEAIANAITKLVNDRNR